MTVEAFVEGLSRGEKLIAMELIWRDLTIEPSKLESPGWHDEVVNERLANPMPGSSLGLKEAFEEIQGWRNDRKSRS